MITLLLLSLITNAHAEPKEVRIGLASNFTEVSTGASNPFGDYFRDGALLALKQSERRLEEKGLKIKFQEFDYGTSDLKVLEAARNAVGSDVLAVIGYNYSSNALLAAQVHHEGKLAMLTPSASANRLSDFGSYVHMGCFNNQFIAESLARIAISKLKAKRAISFPAMDCAYCVDLANEFDKAFKAQGGISSKQVSVLVDDKDFDKAVSSIKNEKFDVVFVPDQEITSARLIAALIQAGVKTTYLGGDGWGDIVENFFGRLKSIPFKGYSISHWNVNLTDEKTKSFVSMYKKDFGKVPNDTSVLAYDSTLLMVQAVLNASTLTREGVEKSLNGIKHFEGVTGKFLLSPNRAPKKSLVLLSTDGTKFKPIDIIKPSGVKQ